MHREICLGRMGQTDGQTLDRYMRHTLIARNGQRKTEKKYVMYITLRWKKTVYSNKHK